MTARNGGAPAGPLLLHSGESRPPWPPLLQHSGGGGVHVGADGSSGGGGGGGGGGGNCGGCAPQRLQPSLPQMLHYENGEPRLFCAVLDRLVPLVLTGVTLRRLALDRAVTLLGVTLLSSQATAELGILEPLDVSHLLWPACPPRGRPVVDCLVMEHPRLADH